jgi:hypothetical protein
VSKIPNIEKNNSDMFIVYTILNERKQNVNQEYHSLIEDFKKFINISKLRDEAIGDFYKKLSQNPPALSEFNSHILRHEMEHEIPEVIFFNFLIKDYFAVYSMSKI